MPLCRYCVACTPYIEATDISNTPESGISVRQSTACVSGMQLDVKDLNTSANECLFDPLECGSSLQLCCM